MPTTRQQIHAMRDVLAALDRLDLETLPALATLQLNYQLDAGSRNVMHVRAQLTRTSLARESGTDATSIAHLAEWLEAFDQHGTAARAWATRYHDSQGAYIDIRVQGHLVAGLDVPLQVWTQIEPAAADALGVPEEPDVNRYSWEPGHPLTIGALRRFAAAGATS